MKKTISKVMTIAMSAIMSLSILTAFSGCRDDENSSGGESTIKMEDPKGTITPSNDLWNIPLNTLHDIKVTQGTKDFIVNGNTEYKIVIPANSAYPETLKGAEEIKYFLSKATGANLEIVSDEGLAYDASKKYISLGDTALVQSAGITVNKTVLTRSGYRIVTKDNSVFLIGGGDLGVLYSAYEFLHHEIGFEAYGDYAIDYKTEKTVKLHEFDVTDVPDIQYSTAQLGWQFFDERNRDRMRFNPEEKIWMGPKGVYWHNSLSYMPKATYQGSHPKWYSTKNDDLCFNARGDEAEFELFFAEFMKNFIAVVNEHPEVDNITITQQDYNTWCDCDACSADKEKYGTNSSTIIKFCNKVSIALEEYFDANDIERTVNICFFAYQQTTAAPVKKDENGNYVPIDEEVRCRDNVGCYYAPISAEFIYDFADPANSYFLDTLDKYCAISPKLYLWIYTINFYNMLVPYNTIHSMQNTYIVAKAHNAEFLFDQVQYNQSNLSDWAYLRTYLSSKLRWDVKANVEQLTWDFMNFYYKDAAPAMKKAFDFYNTWFEYLRSELKVNGSYLDSLLVSTTNYPKGFVNGMLKIFDEAYKAIEPLKTTDFGLYENVRKRIALETVDYLYLNIKFYSADYTADELLAMKLNFKKTCTDSGILRYHESHTLEELYQEWGIA